MKYRAAHNQSSSSQAALPAMPVLLTLQTILTKVIFPALLIQPNTTLPLTSALRPATVTVLFIAVNAGLPSQKAPGFATAAALLFLPQRKSPTYKSGGLQTENRFVTSIITCAGVNPGALILLLYFNFHVYLTFFPKNLTVN